MSYPVFCPQEMMSGLNTSNAVVAFEKMEQKVLSMEAQVSPRMTADKTLTWRHSMFALGAGVGTWHRRLLCYVALKWGTVATMGLRGVRHAACTAGTRHAGGAGRYA